MKGWEITFVSLPKSSWEKERETYFCLPVDLRRSVLQPLETSSAPLAIPSIPPPTLSSLHRCLPGSYAYLLIMLQGCSLEQCLAEELDDNTVGPNCSQMACITRCFQESTNVELFSSGSRFSVFFFLEQTPEAVWTHTKIGLMQHVC